MEQDKHKNIWDKGIIFFDAECLLCNRAIQLLNTLDKNDQLLFSSLQSPLSRMINPSQSMSTLIFYHQGRSYVRSEAIIKILLLIRKKTPARLLNLFPLRLRDGLYNLVARNRKRFWGTSQSCDVSIAKKIIA